MPFSSLFYREPVGLEKEKGWPAIPFPSVFLLFQTRCAHREFPFHPAYALLRRQIEAVPRLNGNPLFPHRQGSLPGQHNDRTERVLCERDWARRLTVIPVHGKIPALAQPGFHPARNCLRIQMRSRRFALFQIAHAQRLLSLSTCSGFTSLKEFITESIFPE